MNIFFEIISIIWQTTTGTIGAFATAIWNNLPEILQLKQIVGYFTPAGVIGLYLGVPTIVVTVAISLIRRAIRDKI